MIILAIGLSMDAFAVSICKGLAMRGARLKAVLTLGLWFGLAHIIMPIIGFFLGRTFYGFVSGFAMWVGFLLLMFIGLNMMREALSDEEEDIDDSISVKTMLPLTIAVSIDALVIGVSIAMNGEEIFSQAAIIGMITFLFTALGVKIGSVFGDRFGSKAELLGGAILVLIAVKILIEGLGLF